MDDKSTVLLSAALLSERIFESPQTTVNGAELLPLFQTLASHRLSLQQA